MLRGLEELSLLPLELLLQCCEVEVLVVQAPLLEGEHLLQLFHTLDDAVVSDCIESDEQ